MRPLSRVLGLRVAFAAALLASACERDSNAEFDDATLPTSSGSGATSSSAGSSGQPPGAGGAADEGGAGALPNAGKPGTAGAAAAAGAAGKPAVGGEGGGSAGGTGTGGSAGSSGSAQAGVAGSGGMTIPDPEPVTIEVTEFEDTTIASCDSNENFSKQATLQTDGDFCRFEALLRPLPPEIPAAAEIDEATLSLYCANAGGTVEISFVTEPWKEGTVRYNTRPERGELVASVTCEDVGAFVTVDLTKALASWLNGELEPYGVYLTTNAMNGTDFGSSNAQEASQRPVLSVTYTPVVK